MELTPGQQFEIERFGRAIDATVDPEQLRQIARQLLQARHTQKAATHWWISQQGGPLAAAPSGPDASASGAELG